MWYLNRIIGMIPEKLRKDKKLLAIVLLGSAAIILLLLSELGGNGDKKAVTEIQTDTRQEDIESYADDVEKRLTELISSIDGAGSTRVMVTFESGAEQVYASNTDSENEGSKSNSSETGVRSSAKGEYIILDTGNGENGLVLKVVQPEVRGVAVVCEGAGSAEVRKDVTEAVSSVLGISSARVSVAKMAVK